jgi:hypothetical protein
MFLSESEIVNLKQILEKNKRSWAVENLDEDATFSSSLNKNTNTSALLSDSTSPQLYCYKRTRQSTPHRSGGEEYFLSINAIRIENKLLAEEIYKLFYDYFLSFYQRDLQKRKQQIQELLK